MSSQQVSYLIVDWGTTNFRAFAMGEGHELLDKVERPMGLLQVENGDFGLALENLLNAWLPNYNKLPIFMAGMVGSAKGWHQVEYVQTSAGHSDLWQKAHQFQLPWGSQGVIFPGLCHQYEEQMFDVMRGEEIQIFGLAHRLNKSTLSIVLPGTHSKHVSLVDNQVTEFSSFLTGEFYSLLSQHSLLGKGLPQTVSFNQDSFLRGVNEGKSGKLTNKVFLTWTHRLFKNLDEDSALDYLSGLLLGYELSELTAKDIYLVGGSSLSQRYKLAAEQLGHNAEIVSGDECFLTGMVRLVEEKI